MRFLFFIQGEGRGHQTQALALHGILTRAGHEVVAAIVGTTAGRGIPGLLREGLPVPMTEVPSPALLYSNRSKSLDLRRTLSVNVRRIPRYWRTARVIHEIVEKAQPDVLVNFYEMACGVYHWLYQSPIPTVSIAHQYLMLHPKFKLPRTRWAQRATVNQVTRMTAIGSTRRLALSFYDFPDDPASGIFAVPPLLRAEVVEKSLTPGPSPSERGGNTSGSQNTPLHRRGAGGEASGAFLLAYTTHHRLAEDLIAWNQTHPETRLVAFWDKPDAPETLVVSPTLTFHRVDAAKFLDAMRRCRGLVSTAGFEAISEAMWLGKPVMMLPVPGHFEQACNAFDAERAGAGLRATSFLELDRFLEYLPRHRSVQAEFQTWQAQADERFLRQLTAVVNEPIASKNRFTRWSGRLLRRVV